MLHSSLSTAIRPIILEEEEAKYHPLTRSALRRSLVKLTYKFGARIYLSIDIMLHIFISLMVHLVF